MAVFENVQGVTVIAGADLSAALHKFLFITTTGNAIVQTTAQGMVNGICGMNAPSGAATLMVQPDGARAVVTAGATIAAGDKIACDTTGRAIPWVDAVGNNALGVATEGAAVGEKFAFYFSLVDVGGGS